VALLGVANACGGRTVWVEDEAAAGESGDGGTTDGGASGYGGDYGGGAYGGTGYTGGYGGDYGGTGYGGSYAGTSYGGTGYGGTGYSGTAGYPYGGVGGTTYTGGIYTGGTAGYPYGGVAGTGIGGVAGSGYGACGPVAGSGGGAGFPAYSKGCTLFCPRYPYKTCPSNFNGPQDCLSQCQNAFGLPARCQRALYDFLICSSQVLDPNAQCMASGDGLCYGPGCTVDAVNYCADSYYALIDCQETPDPCPPPPEQPPPPGCSRGYATGGGYCEIDTYCQNVSYTTQCSSGIEGGWYCDCVWNGQNVGSVAMAGSSGSPCQEALKSCGFP
jgi:hypothetical protein